MLWGGRFQQELDKAAFDFSSSFRFDIRLLKYELEVNLAHVEMLHKINLLNSDELNSINKGLQQIKEEYVEGRKEVVGDFEDVHSFIESELIEIIGDAALKIHAGRSRNDLVSTSLKLWMRENLGIVIEKLRNLQKTILNLAEQNRDVIIPSYTHLQRAQPVSLAYHLLSFMSKLERDIERAEFVLTQIGTSPLGAGAIAGSTLSLNREVTSKKLGFEFPEINAEDSTNQRDYILDFLHLCNTGMLHLSSLAEELILWSTKEWSFVLLEDRFTTGSSLMPQKKNPDLAELIRSKTGRVSGNYLSLSMTLKALPFGYNRDLQEDKEPLFDSFDTFTQSLVLMAGMLQNIKINKERFVEELKNDFVLATDLADWLVEANVPFREAHKIVGQIVSFCICKNFGFIDLSINDLKKFSEVFNDEVLEVLKLENSLQRKKTFGSPNPELVKKEINNWRTKLSI